MDTKNLNILVSPGFLLGLGLLLLNDFLFKHLFHGWLTGKLSDFSGLFIFPLFWTALFPRFKRTIYLTTATLFIFWKSEYSQSLIDLCSQWLFLPIARTVDLSDLLALSVLPVSYVYSRVRRDVPSYRLAPSHRLAPYFIGCVSLFAFTATQLIRVVRYSETEYAFTESKNELVTKTEHIDKGDDSFMFRAGYPHKPSENPTNKFYVLIKPDFCGEAEATVTVENKNAGCVMTLKEISYGDDCPEHRDDKEKLLAIFEKDFINKVRNREPSPREESQR